MEAIGNAARHGARIALINRAAWTEIAALARRIEKVETAIAPTFRVEFVAAMAIPHATDTYPKLAESVALPTWQFGQRTRRRVERG